MAPFASFTKIWKMRNNGTTAWPQGSKLVWIGGDKFSHADSADLEIPAHGIPVDRGLDVAVDFISPELPGRYISYWNMASPSGTKFGQRVWVLIQVVSSLKDSSRDSLQGLNLNLHPDWDGSKSPQILDMNVQPEADGGILSASSSTSVSEPMQTWYDQELNFPINDILLLGNDVSDHTAPQSSSVSYPTVDISEEAPAKLSDHNALESLSVSYPIMDVSQPVTLDCSQEVPATAASSSSKEVYVDDTVEAILLKELEEMGFNQIYLNKLILRVNNYNLELSVEDLCNVTE